MGKQVGEEKGKDPEKYIEDLVEDVEEDLAPPGSKALAQTSAEQRLMSDSVGILGVVSTEIVEPSIYSESNIVKTIVQTSQHEN